MFFKSTIISSTKGREGLSEDRRKGGDVFSSLLKIKLLVRLGMLFIYFLAGICRKSGINKYHSFFVFLILMGLPLELHS